MKTLIISLFSSEVYDRACEFLHEAKRKSEYISLAGIPDIESPYREFRKEIAKTIKDLRMLSREAKRLEYHMHEWNEDDYCIVCGADGRA